MISVIVPAYNVEDYIEACVSSILNSTYRDLELILVDDGSTDKTAELCDKLAATDGRIKAIHQQNAGVSTARNVGMEAAKGDFITFVDSDDVIHPEMLEFLLNMISGDDYDMSMVLNLKIDFADRERYLACQRSELGNAEPRIMSQADYFKAIYTDQQGSYTGPCHKLYKRDLLFTEGQHYLEYKPIPAEDVEWLTRVCLRMNKVIVIPLTLYFYVMRDDSVTHFQTVHKINSAIVGRLRTHYECFNLIPKDNVQYRTLCLTDIYRRLRLYNLWAYYTPFKDEVRSIYKNIYKSTIKEYLQMPIGRMAKIKTVIDYYCPWLYRWKINFGEWLVKAKLIRG